MGRNEQNILNAAQHAFLKFGYHGTTMQKISEFAGTGKAAIHYYYGSKDRLFEIVFCRYVLFLLELVKNHDPIDMEISFEKRKIEYPEVYSVAWFVANEFQTNGELVFNIMNHNEEIKAEFHAAYNNNGLKEKFERLIRVNLHVIIQRCRVRINKITD
jgi:AcrR family transcriptional regulator